MLCFEAFFNVIASTYGPISMKLCMPGKSHLKHVFTQFRKVLDFRSGFIGLLVICGQAPFLNEAN